MQFRRLGLSDIKVSTIGMGCIQLGDKADLSETEKIVGRCLDLGINYFDTANIYSDGVGEEYLGRALGGRRKEIILATKVGRIRMGSRRKLVRDSTPEELHAEIEASLKRLGTDYIDLYQIHWPDPDVPIESTMDVMHEFKKAGKIRQIGICNFSGKQVENARAACPELVSLQSPYNLFRRELEYETFPYCVHKGISIIPYWPLEVGILAGRYTSESLPADASEAMKKQVAVVDKLRPLAQGIGRPLSHIALSWLLARPGVVSVIPGASKVDQLEENCRAADWALSSDEVYQIDQILAQFYNK